MFSESAPVARRAHSRAAQEADEGFGRRRRSFAAPDQNAGVDRFDLTGQLSHADADAARHRPGRHQRHQRHAQPRFHHLDDEAGRGRFHVDARTQPQPVERVEHVLPAGRAALEDDQRHAHQVGQRQPTLLQQRVPVRRDQPPVEREQVPVVQPRAALVRCRHAERQVRVAQQRVLDVALGPRAQPNADRGERAVEPADRVEHRVQRQVLRRRDVDLLRPGCAQRAAEPPRALQERDRARQELLALRGERRPPARAALLVVQRQLEQPFERDQPVPQPLFGDVQPRRGGAQAPRARQLHQRRHLIGRDGRQVIGHRNPLNNRTLFKIQH